MRFFHKEQSNYFLILDIGTEAVKTLFVREEIPGKKIILGNSLQYFDQFGVFEPKVLLVEEIRKKAISKAIEEVQKQAQVKANLAKISLPADIFKTRVSSQSFSRKNFQRIDKKEEKEIFQSLITKGQKEIAQNFGKESGILPKDFTFLKFKVLEMKINGYEVPKLFGYKGEKIDFKILFTLLAKGYLEKYQKIFQELGLENFSICHPFENFKFLLDKQDGVFLDIGGSLSQGFLVKNRKLETVFDFPIGARHFSQTISKTLAMLPERSRLVIEKYSKGELSEEVRKSISRILSKDTNLWFQGLNNYLGFFPKIAFLFGGGALLPEIKEILTKNGFLVRIILPKDLLSDSLSVLNSPQYLPSLLTLF